jgi:anti-sigma regulatory factor (Ser/Thr protein kinase)
MTSVRAEIRLPPGIPVSAQVAGFVGELAAAAGLSRRAAYRLRLACDELAANIIEHGYAGRAGGILLRADYGACDACLLIEDDGPPFDPTSVRPSAPYGGPLPPTRAGGAGLLLVRGSVDRFGYEYADGRNRTFVAICGAAP